MIIKTKDANYCVINHMLIKVKVFPNSKKMFVGKKAEDSFGVHVKEKAERGLANGAVIAALASFLRIPSSKIRLVRGTKKRSKIFKI